MRAFVDTSSLFKKYLDAIQLASGVLSKADVFVTSDHRLFEEAKKEVPRAVSL